MYGVRRHLLCKAGILGILPYPPVWCSNDLDVPLPRSKTSVKRVPGERTNVWSTTPEEWEDACLSQVPLTRKKSGTLEASLPAVAPQTSPHSGASSPIQARQPAPRRPLLTSPYPLSLTPQQVLSKTRHHSVPSKSNDLLRSCLPWANTCLCSTEIPHKRTLFYHVEWSTRNGYPSCVEQGPGA